MKKTYRTFISILLLFSLTAPTAFPWIVEDYNKMVLVDSAEEENKKESEEKLGEKFVFGLEYVITPEHKFSKNEEPNFTYLEIQYHLVFDIILPPPEVMV